MNSSPRVGWLFAYDWDRGALQRLGAPGGPVSCDHAGFDLFSYRSRLRLRVFDIEHFAQRQAARGSRSSATIAVVQHEVLVLDVRVFVDVRGALFTRVEISSLADMTGRKPGNLSRTLKTMSNYGLRSVPGKATRKAPARVASEAQ